jgi:hypothetical protein
MFKEICEFIEDKASLTIGTDLFSGHRPQDAPDACDTVLETGGGSIYTDQPDRADVTIQVLSRAKTYFTARARAWNIYDAIYNDWTYGSAGWTLSGVDGGDDLLAMVIEPLAVPQYIGQDEKGRYEFSTNYIFRIRDA